MTPFFKPSKHIYPWKEWFSYAVLTLRIKPQDFWHLSLTEWHWILQTVMPEANSLNRENLLSLLKNYPDQYYGRTDQSNGE